jgi:hypothetical protein
MKKNKKKTKQKEEILKNKNKEKLKNKGQEQLKTLLKLNKY